MKVDASACQGRKAVVKTEEPALKIQSSQERLVNLPVAQEAEQEEDVEENTIRVMKPGAMTIKHAYIVPGKDTTKERILEFSSSRSQLMQL